MKIFDWSNEKNDFLKKARGISFEQVVEAINDNRLITIIKHSNTKKYPNQKIFIVEIEEYVYLVPFVEVEDKIFLKTIFPSRKYTKIYVEERNH